MRRLRFALVSAVLVALALACGGSGQLILATTTSTQDSGLLDVLVPMFERESSYGVKTIAVGSGQALRLGEEGEADVLLVHSPKAEEDFMTAGHGEDRLAVMHNDFIIVGPPDDPAHISGLPTARYAFIAIADTRSPFVSRGDESGTHTKELALWEAAVVQPSDSWYQETGLGMGQTLLVADQKRAYTLSDRATFLAQRDNLALDILVQGDPQLINQYHVIVVSPDKHPNVNAEGARAFARFLTSPEAQAAISDFQFDKYGQHLFVPDALSDSTPGPSPSP